MFDRCLYFNSRHLARVIEKIMKDAYADLKISPSHAYLLRLVLQSPGLLQKEIGDLLHLEKSTITRFIDKMVTEGYLTRKTRTNKDIRLQYIYPTNKSQLIAKQLDKIGNELYQSFKNRVGDSTLSSYVNEMKIITKKIQAT